MSGLCCQPAFLNVLKQVEWFVLTDYFANFEILKSLPKFMVRIQKQQGGMALYKGYLLEIRKCTRMVMFPEANNTAR